MSKTNDILEAAHAIRPQLQELLGADAETVEPQLEKLLTQSGSDVDTQILDLLGDYQATSEWIHNFLDNKKRLPVQADEGDRGFSPLPGTFSTSPCIARYTCPDDKAGRTFSTCNTCDYSETGWARQSNETIPLCPEFGKPLKLLDKSQQY